MCGVPNLLGVYSSMFTICSDLLALSDKIYSVVTKISKSRQRSFHGGYGRHIGDFPTGSNTQPTWVRCPFECRPLYGWLPHYPAGCATFLRLPGFFLVLRDTADILTQDRELPGVPVEEALPDAAEKKNDYCLPCGVFFLW